MVIYALGIVVTLTLRRLAVVLSEDGKASLPVSTVDYGRPVTLVIGRDKALEAQIRKFKQYGRQQL